jgi:hypothetical protein
MFTLNNPTKTSDLSAYKVTSQPCPTCNETLTVRITPQQLFAYNQGDSILNVLGGYDADVRERFMSGLCAYCWDGMFGTDEDEEYIDYYAESSLFGDC